MCRRQSMTVNSGSGRRWAAGGGGGRQWPQWRGSFGLPSWAMERKVKAWNWGMKGNLWASTSVELLHRHRSGPTEKETTPLGPALLQGGVVIFGQAHRRVL
ncbi:hypothetical protein Syun_011481 [Stephania yunnanensis]|uniref:Uncharacterized protein n=1 Tax=Stephania yunnanensis TaxID=152371 RepID=A0AAP0JXV6_9MAGN